MPRYGWLALIAIVLGTLSGCLGTEQGERSSFLKRSNNQTIMPDHALIEFALVERPIGDEYINKKIWEHADDLIDQDRHGLLDENGFRIGQLVGVVPSEFQQLLLDKRCTRNPQGMIFPAGKTMPIFLGPTTPLKVSSYDIVRDKVRTEVTLNKVRYGLDVTAQFTGDGKTKLTFAPGVENGEATLPFKAVPEQQRWEMNIGKASRKYPELSWDVTLGPNQYCIVGARLERLRTLGQTAFTQFDGELGVQRLLVIRNCQSVAMSEAHQRSVDELVRADKAPPLAVQATMAAYRGKAP